MKKPEQLNEVILASLARYASQHEGVNLDNLVAQLQFDCLNGCYFFVRAGMYHGVELDGYIHT